MFSALVVDDEDDICDFLNEKFEELEVEVKTVTTGEQAVEWIHERKWDIAVVDLKLSTPLTGLDVIKAIRESSPSTIVYAMTGYVDIGLKQQAENLGVKDYLSKPSDIMPDAFLKKMKSAIATLESRPRA